MEAEPSFMVILISILPAFMLILAWFLFSFRIGPRRNFYDEYLRIMDNQVFYLERIARALEKKADKDDE